MTVTSTSTSGNLKNHVVVDLNHATRSTRDYRPTKILSIPLTNLKKTAGTVYLQAVVLRLRHSGPEKLEDNITQTPQVRKDVHVVTLACETVEDGACPEGEALSKRKEEGDAIRGRGG